MERRETADPEARAILRKVSWRLLPLLALGYGIAYIDRVNISFAALQMKTDLHFSASVYGLGAGLFFLGYALLEMPSNMLLVRFGARHWIARIMLTWGVLATAMMFVRTPFQFYALRLLLGAAEAGFFPGVLFYLTLWFPPTYSGRAISRFYVALPLSTAIMGAVAGPLLNLEGVWGLAGWQWLFLVEGTPAILLGAVIFYCLPDGPHDARWLSGAERAWLLARVPSASHTLGGAHGCLREALGNPLVWKLGGCNFLIMGTGYAFALSVPTLLTGATQWSPGRVGNLMALAGLGGAVALMLNGWHSDRHGERHVHTALPLAVEAAAVAVLGIWHSPAVVIPAYVVFYLANAATQSSFWPIASTNLQGRSAAVGVAAVCSIGMFGAFLGPYAFGLARDVTGSYRSGLLAVAAAYGVAAVALLVACDDGGQAGAHPRGGTPSAVQGVTAAVAGATVTGRPASTAEQIRDAADQHAVHHHGHRERQELGRKLGVHVNLLECLVSSLSRCRLVGEDKARGVPNRQKISSY